MFQIVSDTIVEKRVSVDLAMTKSTLYTCTLNLIVWAGPEQFRQPTEVGLAVNEGTHSQYFRRTDDNPVPAL